MDSLLQQLEDWLKEMLVAGIMENLSDTFSSVNTEVGEIATMVGQTPSQFMPGVYSLIRNLSENVIMPVAGIILTFIACYELIQLVISHNNLANFETWFLLKWVFKTFIAVTLITNTFNITMAIFDVAQWIVQQSGGLIANSTAVDDSAIANLEATLESMTLGPLFGVFMQSLFIGLIIKLLAVIIFVIVNGRMIEIYLTVSLAPIPFSTFGNKEQSMMGQNYLRSLWALALQGFILMVCVGIYAV